MLGVGAFLGEADTIATIYGGMCHMCPEVCTRLVWPNGTEGNRFSGS